MYTTLIANPAISIPLHKKKAPGRIHTIDLLRGVVMIIMALDHVRDYFHKSAFLFSPEDLTQTSPAIFFTRWITHFCAPIFVLLAGISANIYGANKGKLALFFFLITRGIWLCVAELFIVTLEWTFNPSYPFFNLQVIWATGISMILLAAIIFVDKKIIFVIGVFLIAGHNLLDNIQVKGSGMLPFIWSLLHEPGYFVFGKFAVAVRYPLIPWMGVMAVGYCLGDLYTVVMDSKKRRNILLVSGFMAISVFIILRAGNWYGDAVRWALQKDFVYDVLSFLNVTKYPPSLLYVLMTLGPACLFLALSEKRLQSWTSTITLLGRVPMFYYLAHIFLIHLLAIVSAGITGYNWSAMILSARVNSSMQLKGYGFSLPVVYTVWALVILMLCPLCKRFDLYKRSNQSRKWWLRYL